MVAANDEFFAAKENLVLPEPPVERDRVRAQGQGVRRLGDPAAANARATTGRSCGSVRPGIVAGVVVDTSFFTGNYPPRASVDGAAVEGHPHGRRAVEGRLAAAAGAVRTWPATPHNYFPVYSDRRVTHVRLNIHPDGGVARLRVHGTVLPDPRLARRRRRSTWRPWRTAAG